MIALQALWSFLTQDVLLACYIGFLIGAVIVLVGRCLPD